MPLPQPTIRMGGVNRWGTKTGKILFQQYDEANKLHKPVPIDHSRNSGGWRINKNGIWERQPDNYPRITFDKDPSGELLNEAQSQNILPNPENFNAWSKQVVGTGIPPIVTSNFGTFQGRPTSRIDFEVADLDDNSRSYIQDTCASSNGVQSIYARSLDGSPTITMLGDSANDTVVGTEWKRYSLEELAASAIRLGIIDSGGSNPSATASIEVALAMFEPNVNYPGTILPDANSTRSSDALFQSGLADLIGQSEGTLYVRGSVFDSSTVNSVVFSDGTLSNRLGIRTTSGNLSLIAVASGSTINAGSGSQSVNSNEIFEAVLQFKDGSFEVFMNGNSSATASSGISFTLNNIFLSRGDGNNDAWHGRIPELAWWKTALTSNELTELLSSGMPETP